MKRKNRIAFITFSGMQRNKSINKVKSLSKKDCKQKKEKEKEN